MVLLQRKLYFSKDPGGVQHFPDGGVQLFFGGGGGSKCLFLLNPIEPVIFQGDPDPLSPLWIRT